MPSLLDFPKEYVKENSFEVHITVPKKRFFNLSIDVCRVSEETTCITEVLNNTYSYANESVTKNLTVKSLTLATNYSITAKTGITNEVKSVTSFIYYMQTEPNPVNVDKVNTSVVTNSTLTVVWSKPPAYTNGYETQWNCESPNIGTGIDTHQIENGTQLSSTAVNLDPGTFCNVTITAYIINYDNATLQATTPGIPESIENTDLTSRTSTIELQEPNKRNVEATNAIATGKPSDLISVRTKETNPGSVQQLNYQDVSSKSVGVSWTKPCSENGILTGYSVTITKLLSEGQEESAYTKSYKIDVANESTSISALLPYRRYKVEVYALNSAGDGELSNVSFWTEIDYPEKPIKVSTKNKTSSSLLIEWEKADHFNDTLATECTVPGLDAYWEYDIVVDAITFEKGHAELIESSERKTFRTAEAVPGPVAQFDVTPEENVLEERNFHIDWKKPIDRDLNGVLTGFIEIQARTSVGPGAAVHKEITVNPGAPIKVDESKNPLMLKASVSVDDDEKQIAVTLPLAEFVCNRTNGPPTMWGIVVAEADEAASG
ncbi:PTPRQ-like protein [Mya arenaria]|uniref:PTPRQ-like protein n=1 Tax=Mya arenaria TaxID=6604 RepID=A0ABY7EJP2_MYAAR|nr:PTPRQ-like protein [Mya arenaria]